MVPKALISGVFNQFVHRERTGYGRWVHTIAHLIDRFDYDHSTAAILPALTPRINKHS
jgi:hypothetical protein